MLYKQCTLRSENLSTTCWVPETLAKQGKTVAFDDDDEEKIWVVEEVCQAAMTEEQVRNMERYFLLFSYGHAGKKSGLVLKPPKAERFED